MLLLDVYLLRNYEKNLVERTILAIRTYLTELTREKMENPEGKKPRFRQCSADFINAGVKGLNSF
jgi:hypothetical protein